jgi:hypothetical protein
MTKKALSLFVGALMLTAGAANAQLAMEIIFDGTDVAPTNNGTTSPGSAEFDGVAVTPDAGTIYLFDSIGAFDGILAYNVAGTSFSTFATEAQLAGSASAGDMYADATNLYAAIFTGSDQTFWRIPHAGGFASAVDMVASNTTNADEIAIDVKNSRMLYSFNDAFSAAVEDIYHVPLNASGATGTLLVSEATLEAALAGITGYTDDTAMDLNIYDMAVQSDGDVIVSHGFDANALSGTLLRVTDTGTVSVFRTAADIKTSAGVDPTSVNIASVEVITAADDKILMVVTYSAAAATLEPFIALLSADGTTQTHIANETELEALLQPADLTALTAGTVLMRTDSKATMCLDAAGNLY